MLNKIKISIIKAWKTFCKYAGKLFMWLFRILYYMWAIIFILVVVLIGFPFVMITLITSDDLL